MESDANPPEGYVPGNDIPKLNYDVKQQGFKALKIAIQDPTFVDSLEKAVRNVEKGKAEVLEDDFFD